MIKILLKKQLTEIFKAYFFDMKKNKARSKASTIVLFVVFVFLMLVVMGSIFGALSFALCPIVSLGFGWLYYGIIGLLSVLLGVFGSVFSTYSGLYLSKDNDLLLSLPIPVNAIMVSRLLGVYLMGLMYSAVVIVPAVIVRFLVAGTTTCEVIGAVLFLILISLFVLALSCILGYAVARISLKLKNKSFITVIIALVFFALYYYVYFNANTFLSKLIGNIATYGAAIKDKAYPVYIIGSAAEGSIMPALIVSAVVFIFLFATLFVIARSFIKIATSTTAVAKAEYKQKRQNAKSQTAALLSRELKRFTSNANYMLNCGLGAVFMVGVGAFVLIKGETIRNLLSAQFSGLEDMIYIAVAVTIGFLISMNDIATPSVSLEGKTLWQIRSLPVSSKSVLKAKYLLQICINILPALIYAVCLITVLRPDVITGILIVLFTAVYVVFNALFCMICGLCKVNLNWTNEIVPIKQGVNILFALFGGWAISLVIGLPYLFLNAFISAKVYMAALLIILSVLSLLFYRRINTKGVKTFEAL